MANEFPGVGVMLGMLGGNRETVEAIKASLGKKVASAELEEKQLTIRFEDGSGIRVFDGGQSYCESRYMRSDDEMSNIIGGVLTELSTRKAEDQPDEYGQHEVQFLIVMTDKGSLNVANHHEHSGYYGGFWMEVEPLSAE